MSFNMLKSKFSKPGPSNKVGGVFPIPGVAAPGSLKLAFTASGVPAAANGSGLAMLRRNGIPPVGVPVQYPMRALTSVQQPAAQPLVDPMPYNENRSVQFRFEFLNSTNYPNWQMPTLNILSGSAFPGQPAPTHIRISE